MVSPTYQAAISTFARAMQWDSVSRKFVILAANWGSGAFDVHPRSLFGFP